MGRSNSLDALRGLAILAMVLSGSIAFGHVLPAWMFHAQVPPPQHVYNPALPGITWVDLVFPFFLFSMGAAFPLALHKRAEQGPWYKTLGYIVQRYLLLVFFALFTLHARAGMISAERGITAYLLSIACFVLLFFMFTQLEGKLMMGIKILAFVLAALFLMLMPFADGKGFNFNKSDIIIIVLANMAFFGSLTWWGTRNHPLLRIGILPFIMAVFLAGQTEGSWNYTVFNWSPLPWMYTFYYLKYLFIIIPGTFAGEFLMQRPAAVVPADKSKWIGVAVTGCLLILVNLAGLFGRQLLLNLFSTVALCILLYFLQRRTTANSYFARCMQAGVYLLLLGLALEGYEGGIKKDPSTYSYYFVTAGLAFFALLSFSIFEHYGYGKRVIHFFAMNGRNPMVAYTAGNLVLIPLLYITGAMHFLDSLQHNAAEGLLRGVLFTGTVSLITILFVKNKWYWKT